MKLFIKYIRRSMFENKGRLFLLIFSIAISTALLVASIGVISVILNAYQGPKKATAEGKDVSIVSNASGEFFKLDDFSEDGIKNIDGEIRTTGILDDEQLCYANIVGKQYDKIVKDFIIEGNLDEFVDNKCMLSQRICKENGLKLGDTFSIKINGEEKDFKIVAICADDGLFYMDKLTQFTMVVPYEYLEDLYSVDRKYNYASANITEKNIKDSVTKFNDNNDDFKATKLFNEEGIMSEMSTISSGLYIMLSIVILISAIIIFGAFKLIVTERLSIIGTFLSQGATHRKVESILILESIGYGFLGGLFGNIVGCVTLYAINYFMSPLAEYNIREPFVLNVSYIIIGFVFAVALSLISSLIPINSIKKLPVKNVILNQVVVKMTNGWTRFVVGFIFILIGSLCCFSRDMWAVQMGPFCLMFEIIGITMAYKKIVELISSLLCKVLKGKSNILYLAINNMKSSKVLLDSIMLIIIAFSAVLIITSVGDSLSKELTSAFTDLGYDISINNILQSSNKKSTTDSIIEDLKKIDGVNVESINPYVIKEGTVGNMMVLPMGIKAEAFANYNTYLNFKSKDNKEAYDKLIVADNKEVVIPTTLLNKLGKEIGDTITIDLNEQSEDYKIIATIEGKSYNNGIFILINYDEFVNTFKLNEATSITISVDDDIEKMIEKVSDVVAKYGATCSSREADLKANSSSIAMIVKLLSVFSYLAVIIASIGVLNNITIGFLQRKREFAVLCSVGMNGSRRNLLLMTEALLTVIWTFIITIPASFIFMVDLTRTMEFTGMPVTVELNWSSLPIYCLVTLLIVFLATLPILKRSKNISIIQELKYE